MLRTLVLLCSLLCLGPCATAQITSEDRARDDLRYGQRNDRSNRDDFSGQLWYGAGAQLGFQGGNNQSFFQIGVSPIVGYKLTNFLSVGPRGSLVYNNFAYDVRVASGAIERQKENWIGWSAGLFTRAKIFQPFFAHVEYSLVSDQEFFASGESRRETRAIPFLGGGISQGGGPGQGGFEFMVLFRLTPRDRLNDQPFEIRSGFNYNF